MVNLFTFNPMKYQLLIVGCLFSFCAVAQPLTRIAFGSCSIQDSTSQMWGEVTTQKPQLWIWLGDMIYADTHDMRVMGAKYDKQKSDPGYQLLLQSCSIIGTWDDHDYGQNDGGKYYSRKNESKEEMMRFLNVPADDPVRKHAGVYSTHTYGNGNQKVKVILLDTRAFRDTIQASSTKGKKYDPNPTGDLLGEEQWFWFEQQIKNSDAAIHIIGSSIQFISNDHGYEKWGNFPKSRQRMLDLLVKYKIKQPLIISGDRHIAEISKMQVPGLPYPLYDFTSSGLTHTWSFKDAFEKNQYRIGKMVVQKNFGLILIDWSGGTPKITLEIRGKNPDPWDKPVMIN